jgi:hypothetical protein
LPSFYTATGRLEGHFDDKLVGGEVLVSNAGEEAAIAA